MPASSIKASRRLASKGIAGPAMFVPRSLVCAPIIAGNAARKTGPDARTTFPEHPARASFRPSEGPHRPVRDRDVGALLLLWHGLAAGPLSSKVPAAA